MSISLLTFPLNLLHIMSQIDLSAIQNPQILGNDLTIILGVPTVSVTVVGAVITIYRYWRRKRGRVPTQSNDTELQATTLVSASLNDDNRSSWSDASTETAIATNNLDVQIEHATSPTMPT